MPGPDAIVRRVRVSGIQVSKFLGFRDVDMDFDRDLHIVAGANNAGKSSLVRMLEVFFEDPSGEDLMALHPLNSYYAEAGPRSLSSVAVHRTLVKSASCQHSAWRQSGSLNFGALEHFLLQSSKLQAQLLAHHIKPQRGNQ